MKRILFTCLFLFGTGWLWAQNGDNHFKNKNYAAAAMSYRNEVNADPSKYFNLAQSYFAVKDFERAIEALENYKAKYKSADTKKADAWLELLRRDDLPVVIENLGNTINSPNSEFVPRISADGKTLYFLSENRDGGKGGEDIWYATRNSDGTWGKPQNLYQLNTTSHEGILAISPDGNVAVVFGNYSGSFGGGDLFYAVRTENGWTYPCNMGGTINTSGWESLAALGPDAKTLIFSTSRKGGQGSSDLWVTQLSEKGWSTPVNIGSKVNTSGDEKFPFIAADGKTLYFSSDGHGGFGGLDLFMVKRQDDTWTNWSEPVNLGRYINTINDDMDFSIPGSGLKGFVVRYNEPEGMGDNDIYTFYMPPKFRPEQVFNVYGRVFDENDSNALAKIRFFDMETGKEAAVTTTDARDGMYNVALPKFKKYQVVIDMKGYLYFSTILDLTNPDLYTNKEGFNIKMNKRREDVERLQAELDRLNQDLKMAIASNSSNVQEMFDKVEKILKEYKQAITSMESEVAAAKYMWLEEEGQSLNLRKDFQLQTARIGAKFELKNIFFDFGKATLRTESEKELDKLFDIMKNSEIQIELGGHSDSIGSEEANQKLSQDRVNSVKAYLVNKGINQSRIVAVGYGESQPVATNSTEEGRAMNRRVEVKILKLTADREGGEVVTEDDKKKKKENKKEEEPQEEVAEKGNMLDLLQKAAKNGGLPSGSSCNEKPVYSQNYDNNKKPDNNNKWNNNNNSNWGNWGTGEKIGVDGYMLKTFNLSLVNWSYKSLNGGHLGAEISFVNSKLNKNALQFYFSNPDSVKFGIGWTSLYNLQLGRTPLMFLWGWDLKYFAGVPAGKVAPDANGFGQLLIPVGLRYAIRPMDKLVLYPEVFYNFHVGKPIEGIIAERSTHLSLGAHARWRMFHGGVSYKMGQEINFLGFRAGVSF